MHASGTFRQNVEFIGLREQLDLHRLTCLFPRFAEKSFLQCTEPTARCADQILNRRLALAHLRQGRLRRNPAIHDPDPFALAVLVFDAIEEIHQRGFVTGISGHHLIGQRKTLRGDNQGDNDLHTVGSFIAAVPVAPFAFIRGIRFKIGAGQVIEQNIKAWIEQGLPLRFQIGEEILFVRK